MESPKVFVSHASDDKERFVIGFAERLRAKGIDAWLDKWEMLPGDSLVDKIFEQGLKDAQAVIIVLSRASVVKPWVREELNAAVVKRINKGSKLIPIVIDDCDIPECLKSTVYERIKNLANYDTEFERIVLSIHGKSKKPPVGQSPRYAQSSVMPIGSLTELDTLVFSECCKQAILQNSEHITEETALEIGRSQEIEENELLESLQIIANEGYLEIHFRLGTKVPSIRITDSGLGMFLKSTRSDYDELVRKLALKIVNDGVEYGGDLHKAFEEPAIIIDHIVTSFENRGLLKLNWRLGGSFFISEISPSLKRWLREES